MPELPEVETTRRGIEPYLKRINVTEIIVKRTDLRQPISPTINEIEGHRILAVTRRSKYLLLEIEHAGTLLIHLGMSGSLRVINPSDPWKKHDHFAMTLENQKQLRFHDPRRFGLILHLLLQHPHEHPLLRTLGPEPLEENFTPNHLHRECQRRSASIKQVIMDAKVVVGVGNIYASESLFRAGIRPQTPAHSLSKVRLTRLVTTIREVLQASIIEGGTTLRDFLNSDGEPGYFKQRLFVYGRSGENCRTCQAAIRQTTIGQRSTFWCPQCQK